MVDSCEENLASQARGEILMKAVLLGGRLVEQMLIQIDQGIFA